MYLNVWNYYFNFGPKLISVLLQHLLNVLSTFVVNIYVIGHQEEGNLNMLHPI
jgi:hypothetical protein